MRRAEMKSNADEYIYGTWDLWMKGKTATLGLGRDFVGKFDMSDGAYIHQWQFQIQGHTIVSDNFPGSFRMICSQDGTLALITVSFKRGRKTAEYTFEAWKLEDA